MSTAFPTEGTALTHLLVVGDLERSRAFYRDVPGAEVHREYGGTSVVLRFVGTWLLLVTGGEPAQDKPDVTFVAPVDPATVSHSMTIRVPDCHGAYATLRHEVRGSLTPPVDYDWEVRAFFRNPDGHLLEISEARPTG
jgi:lactoylglutathione lyase